MNELPAANLDSTISARDEVINSIRKLAFILLGTIIVLLVSVFTEFENKWLLKTVCIIFVILPTLQIIRVNRRVKKLGNLAVRSATKILTANLFFSNRSTK